MNHAKNIFQYTFGSSRCSSRRRRERGDKGDKKIDSDAESGALLALNPAEEVRQCTYLDVPRSALGVLSAAGDSWRSARVPLSSFQEKSRKKTPRKQPAPFATQTGIAAVTAPRTSPDFNNATAQIGPAQRPALPATLIQPTNWAQRGWER